MRVLKRRGSAAGSDAVSQIHALFDWSKTSRRGLMVFIDEVRGVARQLAVPGTNILAAHLRSAMWCSNRQTEKQKQRDREHERGRARRQREHEKGTEKWKEINPLLFYYD